MLNAKLRKLFRDPNLFLSDMMKNRKRKAGKYHLKKEEGHYSYTLVTAVYNVGRYLDDFFKSLVGQKLDFHKHIKLIMVDDGSTDDSALIIKRWMKKYPDNIFYIWKENGGQSSARNLGLEHVTSEWVTFVDPDDFLDVNYFYNIDSFVYKNKDKDISLLGCNVVFYFEKNNFYKETHPLGFKFKSGDVCMPIEKIGKNIQLSASTAIFRTKSINDNNIRFDPEVKPAFEDAKFVQEYLLDVGNSSIGFLRDSKYYYRKREDGTSTLDTAWQKVERFTTTPKYGYLKIIDKCYSNYGFVPEYIQRTLIYEISWHLKWLLNHQERASFLTEEQKSDYINNLKEVFKHIDKKTIINFELSGCWFFHKVGLISFFKNDDPDSQIIYIEKYDSYKKLVQLRYFSRKIGHEHFTVDGRDIIPVFAKNISHDFLGHELVIERRAWFNIGDGIKLNFKLGDVLTRLSLGGKQSTSGIAISDVVKHFTATIPNYKKTHKYTGSWLLMDRDTQADDNAEHLYRYIREQKTEQKIFFILRKESHDWERLKNDGFNLIEFSSHEHELAMQSCSKIISSHADKYVTNYLGPNMLAGRHYVFLQHGVTKDDISNWLNQKENIDCLITASPYEYRSMVEDGSRYYYNEKEVVLTGFPRHDKLIKRSNESERLVIIMPTWRNTIVGSTVSEGNIRQLNPDFMSTKFANCWYNLIHSPVLKALSEEFNFKIAFFPHANIQPYLSLFDTPDYIEIISHTTGTIQDIFSRAAMMITDYSSVAFEMAVQNKQTLYYQFDEDEIYTGGHFYSKGYFDYRKDGFGPVVNDEVTLFKELSDIFKKDAIPSNDILNRINMTFPYRDGKNCERVYESIVALNEPLDKKFINCELLKKYALEASKIKKWKLAEERWELLISAMTEIDSFLILQLVEALTEQGKIERAEQLMDINKNHAKFIHDKFIIEAKALVYMAKHKWLDAIYCWELLSKNTLDNVRYCICLASSKQAKKIYDLIEYSHEVDVFVRLCAYMAAEQWDSMIELNDNECLFNDDKLKIRTESYLLMAHAYNKLELVDSAHAMLVKYESLIQNDPKCRYEIARLAFSTHNWGKLIKQLNINCPDIISLPLEFIDYYLKALTYQGKHQLVDNYLNIIIDAAVYDVDDISRLFINTAQLTLSMNKFSLAESRLDKCIASFSHCDVDCYALLIESVIKQGKLELASTLLSEAFELYNGSSHSQLYRCQAMLNIMTHSWSDALLSFEQCNECTRNNFDYLLCAAYANRIDILSGFFSESENNDIIIKILIDYSQMNWSSVISRFIIADEHKIIDIKATPSILILLSSVYMELGDYINAHKFLVNYESLVSNDPQCRFAICKLAFAQKNWKKSIQQLTLTGIDPSWFSEEIKELYIESLTEVGEHNTVDGILADFIEFSFDEGCRLLRASASSMFTKKIWDLAEQRLRKYIDLVDNVSVLEIKNLIKALIMQGKVKEAGDFLNYTLTRNETYRVEDILETRAQLRMAQGKWSEAIDDWKASGLVDGDNLLYCLCLCNLKDVQALLEIQQKYSTVLSDYNNKVISSFIAIANENWQLFIALMAGSEPVDLINEQSLELKILLMLSMAYREISRFDDAHKCLVLYESKIKDDVHCRFEIVKLSVACKRWTEVIDQLSKISPDINTLPVEFKYYYLYSLYNVESYQIMAGLFNDITLDDNSLYDFNSLRIKMLMKLKLWDDALRLVKTFEEDDDSVYNKAVILKSLGEFKAAFDCLARYRFIDTIEYWFLRADLAQLNDDWEEFYKCSLRIRGKRSGEISIQSSEIDSLINLKMIQNRS